MLTAYLCDITVAMSFALTMAEWYVLCSLIAMRACDNYFCCRAVTQ